MSILSRFVTSKEGFLLDCGLTGFWILKLFLVGDGASMGVVVVVCGWLNGEELCEDAVVVEFSAAFDVPHPHVCFLGMAAVTTVPHPHD